MAGLRSTIRRGEPCRASPRRRKGNKPHFAFEEGGELTRIEILINRLLKRDEIEVFLSVNTPVPYTTPMPGAGESPSADDQPAPPKKTPPGQRRRRRRAL